MCVSVCDVNGARRLRYAMTTRRAFAHYDVYYTFLGMASSRRHEALQTSDMQSTLSWPHQRRYHGTENVGIDPAQIPSAARKNQCHFKPGGTCRHRGLARNERRFGSHIPR